MQRKAEVMTIQISDSFLGGGDFSPGFRVTVEPGRFNIRDARKEERLDRGEDKQRGLASHEGSELVS